MKSRTAMRSLAYLLIIGLSYQVAVAQTSQVAQVSGRVVDGSGASVPGTHISMTNVDTGLIRATDTGDNGSYNLTTLPIGTYRLEATKEGFGKYIQSGIVLDVNTNPTIVVTLTVGTVTQQVTVTEAVAQVETHDSGVGTLVDQQHVVDLPLNGRNVTQLVALSGASVTAPPPSGQAIISNKNYPSASAFAIAGGQAGQTLFVLDGAYNLDPSSNVGLPYPFPDALQEFKVETSSLPANYGSQPGGFVNVVTKSGGNHFHGGAFEFYRNFHMDGSNYFSKVQDTLNRNQFGGEVGGPVMKDKLFFFVGYQGTPENAPLAPATFHVATAASLAGDFTTLASPTCNNGKQITLKAPFVGNKISPTSLNSVAVNFLKYIPTSTDPCGLLVYTVPSTDHENQIVGRVDYTLTSRQNLDFRYFITDFEHPPVFDNNLLNLQTDAAVGLHDRVQSVVAGHTFVINANAVNSFRLSYSRSSAIRYTPTGVPTATQLGANVTQLNPGYVNFAVTGDVTAACTNCSPSYFASNIYQIGDDFTLIRGRHEILFGGDWIHVHFNGHSSYQSNGNYSFNGQITGMALADLETGNLSSFGQSTGAVLHEGVNVPSLYVQDNFKITKNFRFNAGLRWDPYLLPVNYDHHESIFDLTAFNNNVHSTKFTNGPAGTLFYGDNGMPPNGGYGFGRKANFAPRVGIVYDPRGLGKETIRAGYGIFYGSIPLYLVVGTHAPFANPVTIPNPVGGLSNPWLNYPGGNPFPLPNPIPSNTTFPTFGGGLGNYPLHSKPTSIQQWSLSFQKQLPGNWLASATYLGNKTDHLEYNQNQDPVAYVAGTCVAGQYGLTAPGSCSTTSNENYRSLFYSQNPSQGIYYGGLTNYNFGAIANYNALLLSATHTFSQNFSILTNYTWSHCLGESDIGLNGGTAPQNPTYIRGEYGNCGADERQIYNLAITAAVPKLQNHALNIIAGHWQVAPIFTAHTGQYVTVADGTDNSLMGVAARPNLVGSTSVANRTIGQWFNTAAFALAGAGNYGNVGRNTILGPGAWNVDMALTRSIPLPREQTIIFRAEAFNLTNTTHFANPGSSIGTPSTFGVINSSGPPRILQLAAKYAF
jgi:hypothetical protein